MPVKVSEISTDDRNRLVLLNAVTPEENIFRKAVLDGKWSLTPEHDLKIRLSASRLFPAGKTVILKGDIEKATGGGLTFRVRHSDTLSGIPSRSIELKGRWSADSYNRITFNVAKSRGRYDVLRFQGAWDVNKRNTLTYSYVRTRMKTRTRKEHTLVFQGWWDLGASRLVYRVEGSGDSFFAFKAALQSRSLRAADGVIKYQVGIKYLKENVYSECRRTVSIYGTWKVGRGLTASFEAAYSGGKHHKTRFEIEKQIGKSAAEIFLILSRSAAESSIMGGLRVRF